MKPEDSKPRRLLTWVALAVSLLALLWSIHSRMVPVATNPQETRTDDLTIISSGTTGVSAATSRDVGRMASNPSPAGVAACCESGDFTHVPGWIPRPPHAIAATAEDATLRSDGLLEGTVRLTVADSPGQADDWIRKSLSAAGLQARPGSSTHVSSSPPRRCDVTIETPSSGRTLITLRYEASDHGNACVCPTCRDGE